MRLTASVSDLAAVAPMCPRSGPCNAGWCAAAALPPGLAMAGIGVGTLVMPPLGSLLISALGWRSAYLMLGVLAFLFGVGMALLIEHDPRSRGLNPDGDEQATQSGHAGGTSVRDAIQWGRFIGLYAACLICSFGVFVPFVHLVPFARDPPALRPGRLRTGAGPRLRNQGIGEGGAPRSPRHRRQRGLVNLGVDADTARAPPGKHRYPGRVQRYWPTGWSATTLRREILSICF